MHPVCFVILIVCSNPVWSAKFWLSRAARLECDEGKSKCPTEDTCIRTSYFCDGDNDCSDGSDEDAGFCAKRTCPEDMVRCDNGQCIEREDFCHGRLRCRDLSLKDSSASCGDVSCDEGFVKCRTIVRCVPESYLCDGDTDCADGSDEEQTFCSGRTCSNNELKCLSGQCINKAAFCYGVQWCIDHSITTAEANCPPLACEEGFTKCSFVNKCIPDSWLCDDEDDCGDGSDEDQKRCLTRRSRQHSPTVESLLDLDIVTMEPAPSDDPNESSLIECLMSIQSCIHPTVFEPDRRTVNRLIQDVRNQPLAVVCSPYLEMTKCITEKLNSKCDETTRQLLPESYRRSVSSTVDGIEFVCQKQVQAFERNKNCLISLIENGSNFSQAFMASCTDELELLRQAHGSLSCLETRVDLSCAFGIVQERCGSKLAILLNGLARKLISPFYCSTPSRSTKLSVLQRYLQAIRSSH